MGYFPRPFGSPKGAQKSVGALKIIEDKDADDYVKEEHVWNGIKFWERVGGVK